MPETQQLLTLRACSVDLERGLVHTAEGAERLTTREQALLVYLSQRPGQDISRAELLTAVWEYTPQTVTRAIDAVVYRLRRKIEADPADPMHLLTVVGMGYRFVPLSAPALPVLPPAPASPFVGRQAVLEALTALLQTSRLVTVHGPGGIGKTRLVLELLSRPLGCPVRLVELETATDAAEAIALVGRALGLGDDAGEAVIGRHLQQHGALIVVLDNTEHLEDDFYGVIEGWLSGTPMVRWLCTSRAALRIDGEVVLPLQPLTAEEGVALFCTHSRDRGSPVAPDASVEALVAQLDGLPLAIKLAASWSGVLSPSALQERLLSGRTTLRGRPGRHSTLEETVAWSWSLLSGGERAALARCTVFIRPFGLTDAEALLGEDAPLLLRRLLDHALLRRVEGAPRFVLHRSVHAFAAARLAGSADHAAAVGAHAAWVAEQIAALGEPRQMTAAGLQALSDLLPDGVAAVTRAADPVLVVRLAVGLFRMLRFRGPQPRYRSVVLRAVAVREAVPAALRAAVLAEWALLESEDIPAARQRLTEAIALTEGLGDVLTAALYQNYLAAILRFEDPEAEAVLLRAALRHHRHAGSPAHLRTTLLNLSNSARFSGDHAQALRWLDEAEALLGDSPRARVSSLSNRARILQALGADPEGALALLEEAAEICQKLGDARFESRVGIVRAGLLSDQGRGEIGRKLLEELAPLVAACGFDDMQAELCIATGQVQLCMGGWDAAAASFSEAVARYTAMHSRAMVGFSQTGLGVARAMSGRLLTAERALSASAAVGKGGVRDARAAGFLALVRHRMGDTAGAEAVLSAPPPAAGRTPAWALCEAAVRGGLPEAVAAARQPSAGCASPVSRDLWTRLALALCGERAASQ